MSAIPLRQEAPRTCILKLYNADYALDPYSDRLTSQGYEVVNVHNYEDALEEAHHCQPALIVVYDDPDTDIDAVRWLENAALGSQRVDGDDAPVDPGRCLACAGTQHRRTA